MKFIYELFSLDGKVAIVTGGTGVLGSAMAEGLALAGAKVGVLGRRQSAARQVVEAIRAENGEAMPLKADVLNEAQLQKARERVLKQWGKIDLLINAAGGNMPGATITPDETVFNLHIEDFRKVVDLNLLGTVLPTQVFGRSIADNGKGVIINISSMAASRAITRVLGYSTSKAAIDNYTRWMATEMALKFGEGIRVNAIAPGFFIGEQNRRLLTEEDGSLTPRGQTIIKNTPMQRFGQPHELLGTLLWLCSDASNFVTGIVVPVDGGFSAFSGV
ncbi:MAG: SDR family oxidoreductase [Bacteroidetes bacterium]|nr:MAG: SDR family oxidoreductase [Bacteroidota bacterium]